VETVIHHRREFVLYSLRNIEPMKVDMHKLGQSYADWRDHIVVIN